MYKVIDQLGLIIFFFLLDDKCQFWLKESSRLLTSPYAQGAYAHSNVYYHNSNCTWLLKFEEGSYINFEIDFFRVKNNT